MDALEVQLVLKDVQGHLLVGPAQLAVHESVAVALL